MQVLVGGGRQGAQANMWLNEAVLAVHLVGGVHGQLASCRLVCRM
jgi:hypothetical protein